MNAGAFFLIAVGLILLYDGYLYFGTSKETITQWHIRKVRTTSWGTLLPLAWGMLVGHLFL